MPVMNIHLQEDKSTNRHCFNARRRAVTKNDKNREKNSIGYGSKSLRERIPVLLLVQVLREPGAGYGYHLRVILQ
jgi:hypothetical protein